MRKAFTILAIISILMAIWYFDPFHKPVETVDNLIGRNYDFAYKLYFHSNPDDSANFNANKPLNEFQGGVLSKKSIMRDSIIHQFTWTFINHRTTIWVTKTDRHQFEIIDAIRYKNGVKF